ncbi:MAG TPA: head-tail adaptor protein [Mycobacterium sp.]|nr:head-tail adaptor protein [Mycobacterium sp.]
MSFDSLLRHTVTIQRATLGAEDEYGQPSRTFADLATVRALVQPKPARLTGGPAEELTSYDAGTQISDHTIFMRQTDITPADQIVEGTRTFQVLLVKDAAGQGRHYEIDARLIVPAETN